MTHVVSITDDQVFTVLRNWVMGCVTVVDCLQGPMNRASMPPGGSDFVIMSPTNRNRLSFNVTDHPTTNTETNTSSFDYSVQFDCYGPNAGVIANILNDSWYSNQTFELFKPQGLAPLWIDEPRFIPLINGEQQYENRWTMQIHVQAKPSITDSQQSASTVTINPTGIINVDAKYPG